MENQKKDQKKQQRIIHIKKDQMPVVKRLSDARIILDKSQPSLVKYRKNAPLSPEEKAKFITKMEELNAKSLARYPFLQDRNMQLSEHFIISISTNTGPLDVTDIQMFPSDILEYYSGLYEADQEELPPDLFHKIKYSDNLYSLNIDAFIPRLKKLQKAFEKQEKWVYAYVEIDLKNRKEAYISILGFPSIKYKPILRMKVYQEYTWEDVKAGDINLKIFKQKSKKASLNLLTYKDNDSNAQILDAKLTCLEPDVTIECPHKRTIEGKVWCALPYRTLSYFDFETQTNRCARREAEDRAKELTAEASSLQNVRFLEEAIAEYNKPIQASPDAKLNCIDPDVESKCVHKRIIGGKVFCALPSLPKPYTDEEGTERCSRQKAEELMKDINKLMEYIIDKEGEQGAIEAEMEENIKEDLKNKLIDEVRDELREEMKNDVQLELEAELGDQIREEMKEDLQKGLKKQMLKELQEKYGENYKEILKEQMLKELQGKWEKELREEVREEIQKEMKKETAIIPLAEPIARIQIENLKMNPRTLENIKFIANNLNRMGFTTASEDVNLNNLLTYAQWVEYIFFNRIRQVKLSGDPRLADVCIDKSGLINYYDLIIELLDRRLITEELFEKYREKFTEIQNMYSICR